MSGYQPLIDTEPDSFHDPENVMTNIETGCAYNDDSRDSSINDLQQVMPTMGDCGDSGGDGAGAGGGAGGDAGGDDGGGDGGGTLCTKCDVESQQYVRNQYRCVICLEEVAQAYSCKQCNECKICMGCLQSFINSKFCDNTCPVCKKTDDWLMFEHDTIKFYVDANMLRRAFRLSDAERAVQEPIVTVYEYRRNNFENILFSLCVLVCILFAPFFFYYWLLISGNN